MAFSNADKQQHGKSAQDSLESLLLQCREKEYIISIEKSFRVGRSGFSNKSQFYAAFLIEFRDGLKWALFSTTSLRTDRIKGQQWDTVNLKSIVKAIDRAYLVYPDGCSDSNKFVQQNEKYKTKCEYSALDGVVSQIEISDMIEEYALKDRSLGQKKDIEGNNFEQQVSSILSCKENLRKWKTNSPVIEGVHYSFFKEMVECFELDPKTTVNISATSDKTIIKRLPSGGNPKTDVIVEVTDTSDAVTYFTISCKRSSSSKVSVHQYTADAFADVLDKNDEQLRSLLRGFQAAGSMKGFGKEKCQQLQEKLEPYIKKLSFWVLGGIGGDGTPIQCANYILTYDNSDNTIRMHSLEDYYNLLVEKGKKGNFGTPFSWTYPSKHRGKSIQLKCEIIK